MERRSSCCKVRSNSSQLRVTYEAYAPGACSTNLERRRIFAAIIGDNIQDGNAHDAQSVLARKEDFAWVKAANCHAGSVYGLEGARELDEVRPEHALRDQRGHRCTARRRAEVHFEEGR